MSFLSLIVAAYLLLEISTKATSYLYMSRPVEATMEGHVDMHDI